MRNRLLFVAGVLMATSTYAVPGDKRTILTSGERVQTIHYQLGQSTVLFFGMRPDTVICGNKNYFNIEKIKEGLTVQPLSNFSTNLTVLTQGKRFLFYLTPIERGARADTFVDVRWVAPSEVRQVSSPQTQTTLLVSDLNQKLRVGTLDIHIKRILKFKTSSRSILEFEVKNSGKTVVRISDIEIIALKGLTPLSHQITVFESDQLKTNALLAGRLIVTGTDLKGASLAMNYLRASTKIRLKGVDH